MTKGLVRTRARGKPALAGLIKLDIPLRNLPITVNGASGVGFGTAVIRGLPQGNILFLGAVATNFQFTTANTGVTTTYDGDFSIGTSPTADAALSGTEVDIIASTALGAATARVSPVLRAVNAAQSILDNTAATLELNLNLLIDDATISADAVVMTVTGVLSIAYVVLGDD